MDWKYQRIATHMCHPNSHINAAAQHNLQGSPQETDIAPPFQDYILQRDCCEHKERRK
jgi:hypothetical protein